MQLLRDIRNGILVGLFCGVLFVVTLSVLRRPSVVRDASSVAAVVPHGRGVPVLCYHFLRENTGTLQFIRILGSLFLNLPLLSDLEVWTQTRDTFDHQMAYLKREGYETIGMRELVAWRHGLGDLPRKPVVITFDDADRSVYEIAYPILRKYGFTATLFVPTANVGTTWDSVKGMDWDEIRELRQSGVFTIESHSHEFHYIVDTDDGRMPAYIAASRGLYELDDNEDWRASVYRDLRRSRVRIRKELGYDSRYFAWPYGFGTSELDSIAVAAGFHAVCTLRRGKVHRYPSGGQAALAAANGGKPQSRWERFEINRYTITARTSLRGLRKMLDE